MNPPQFKLITADRELDALIAHLRSENRIAVDLEADSLFHYQEKICLIQISTASHHFIVDPLSLSHVSELQVIFGDPAIQKIFHSADNDLRSLYRDYAIVVTSLFDTQLACRFLGCRTTGLESVLKDELGIVLDKKFQKKDWSQRPLSKAMLAYAVQDTAHLIQLADITLNALKSTPRLAWFEEECELLSHVRPAEPNDQPLFCRFKGAHKLPARQLAVLEGLLQARDALARAKDKPLFKLIGNDALLRIAQQQPISPEQLKSTRALSTKQFNMYADVLTGAVQTALKIPTSQLPHYPIGKSPHPDAVVSERVTALKKWRSGRAQALDLEPGLLCNNVLIQALASHFPQTIEALTSIPDMKKWQREHFGAEILGVLQGITSV